MTAYYYVNDTFFEHREDATASAYRTSTPWRKIEAVETDLSFSDFESAYEYFRADGCSIADSIALAVDGIR